MGGREADKGGRLGEEPWERWELETSHQSDIITENTNLEMNILNFLSLRSME